MCGQVDTYAIKPKCNQVMNASKTAPKGGGKGRRRVEREGTQKKRQGKTQTRNSNKLICTRNERDVAEEGPHELELLVERGKREGGGRRVWGLAGNASAVGIFVYEF